MRTSIRRATPFVLATLVVFLVPVVAAGDPEEGVNGVWHRENLVSHEQLVCNGPDHRVTCSYGAIGEAGGTHGDFHGVVAECEPPWEGSTVCDDATKAVRGQMTFFSWQGKFVPFSVGEMIVLYGDGHMALVWEEPGPSGFGPFYCPWYRSWETAQTEPSDCTVIPTLILPAFDGNENAVLEAGQALADYLAAETGSGFSVVTPTNPIDMYELLCAHRGSAVAIVPTTIYAIASGDCGVGASFKAFRFGADHSKSQFLVHTDSAAVGLGDLDGSTWAFSSLTSYSGYMVPLGMLNQAGVTPGPTLVVTTHPAAAQAVHEREADFATTFVSPNLDGLDVKVLAYSGEIPHAAVAFGAEFPGDLRADVEAFLWSDGRGILLQSMDTLYPPWGWEDIVVADDADWDWLRGILWWAGIGIGDL